MQFDVLYGLYRHLLHSLFNWRLNIGLEEKGFVKGKFPLMYQIHNTKFSIIDFYQMEDLSVLSLHFIGREM